MSEIAKLWNSKTLVKGYVIRVAAGLDVTLSRDDIAGEPGAYTIDGMPWVEWLDTMTD